MTFENRFLFHAAILGFYFTFVYDLFRVLRRVIPHNNFFISLEDICFWIYCGEKVFLLMYHESNGTLRWFAVMGAFVGIMIYRKLISPFFVKYFSMLFQRIFSLLGKMISFLIRPMGILFRRVNKSIKNAGEGIRKTGFRLKRATKNRLTYFLKMLKMSIRK